MPVSATRLRRWFAAALIFVCAVVAGVYFYARHRVQNALKQVPGKIGIEIQQSAQGFTISKSEQGRTLFKLQASKAVQFKERGRAELHDVTITLYGRDSSRFDQVYGQDFEYDQQSGNVTAQGEVSIDLQANPQGVLNPDQSTPRELKDPIHLKTTDLVFNQKTGDAWTKAAIEFRVSQANGSAVGAKYVAKEGTLTLESAVKMAVNGSAPSTIRAQQAVVEKNPREILLRYPRAEAPDGKAQADELTLFLRDDNTLDHTVATGQVRIESTANQAAPSSLVRGGHAKTTAPAWSELSAQKLEAHMGRKNVVETAVLSGDVQFKNEGPEPAEASAGRAIVDFGRKNVVRRVHTEQQVRLLQRQRSGNKAAQDVEITAPAIDFFVANGRLARAETTGAPEISLLPTDKQTGLTHVTADKFIATFDDAGQLAQVRGEANARVVMSAPPQTHEPDRVSTSDHINAFFRPGSGIEALIQQGNFRYRSGTQQAFADSSRYAPADENLVLTGSPRVIDAGMETAARSIRLNRSTGDGFADGDVKTSYSDLKAQPSGALLASSDPIHVTAQHLTAHKNPAVAVYTGNARLWQNANVIEAPSIQFQKEQRMLSASADSKQKVSTRLIGTDKSGKATPVVVTANHLTYRDSDRKAHFEGVIVRGVDLTVASDQMDVFLKSATEEWALPTAPGTNASATSGAKQNQGLARLDKIIATGSVVITEPSRRATGDQLTYTASDDKFVLTGGPPSIFDAEHGKITGVSLTLFRRDDRVVVEGDSSSPAVTQTRVVR